MAIRTPISLRDYSGWTTKRLQRALVVSASVFAVCLTLLVVGAVGVAEWTDTAWHVFLAVALVVAGTANGIVFGGASVRILHELRIRRNPLSDA